MAQLQGHSNVPTSEGFLLEWPPPVAKQDWLRLEAADSIGPDLSLRA